MTTTVTIRKDVFARMQSKAASLIVGAWDNGDSVTFTIEEDTIERLEHHYPDLPIADALERLFRGRLH